MVLLANHPKHSGLQSHEIEVLTSRYGIKVWFSHLQNNTPAAGGMIAFVRIACGNKIT